MPHFTKPTWDVTPRAKKETELVIVIIHPFSDGSDERFPLLLKTVKKLYDSIDKLQAQRTNFTRIRPVKVDLDPVQILETRGKGILDYVDTLQERLDGKPKGVSHKLLRKKHKSTEYLFIAFELAGWVVKEFLDRVSNAEYSKSTRSILFLGDWSKMPSIPPTSTPGLDTLTKYVEEYLDQLSSSGSMEPNGVEPEFIAKIEDCFARQSDGLPEKAWRILVSYFQPEDSRVLRFRDGDNLAAGLLELIRRVYPLQDLSDLGDRLKDRAERYNETVEFTFSDVRNRSSRGKPMTTPDASHPTNTRQHTTRPEVSTTQAPPEARSSLDSTRLPVSAVKPKAPAAPTPLKPMSRVEPITPSKPVAKSGPATASTLTKCITATESTRKAALPERTEPTRTHHPPENLQSTQMEALMEALICKKHLADAYLVEGDLWNAQSLYIQCQHSMMHIEKPSDTLPLEIIAGQSAVLLELGIPEKAMADLSSTWRRENSAKDDLQPELRLALVEVAYWYAKGLFRFGLYTKALESIQDAMGDMWKLRSNPSPEFRKRHLHLAINFHQLRVHSLGESRSSHQLKPAFEDIKDAENLLGELGTIKPTENFVESRRDTIAHLSFALSRAYILRQQGMYEAALEKAEMVLASLEKEIGFHRPLTLRAAILCSDCLVNSTKVDQGEKLSLQVKEVALKLLGKDHPLTMEATHVLVSALKIQGRQTEALCTSRYLCDTAKSSKSLRRSETVRLEHSTFLRYRAQLGNLLLQVGHYVEAEEILRDTYQRSASDNPDTWRYLSELSWAQLHLQQLESAEDSNSNSLIEQLKYFDSQVSTTTLKQPGGTVERFVETLAAPAAPLNIVFSLFVMCQIELYQPEPRLKFVCDTAKYVFQQTKEKFGERHSWTLMTKLVLGEAYSASGQSSRAEECFEWVSRQAHGGTHLDDHHPLILRARTELIRTELMFSDASMTQNLNGYLETLHAIHHCQRLIPGPAHPDTLETLLLLLTLQISADNLASEETKNMLLGSLQDPTVQKQRCMESLNLQERVAEVYWGHNERESCRHIVEDLVDNIEKVRKERARQLSEVDRVGTDDAKRLGGFERVREDHAKRLREIEAFGQRIRESLRVIGSSPQSLEVVASLEYA